MIQEANLKLKATPSCIKNLKIRLEKLWEQQLEAALSFNQANGDNQFNTTIIETDQSSSFIGSMGEEDGNHGKMLLNDSFENVKDFLEKLEEVNLENSNDQQVDKYVNMDSPKDSLNCSFLGDI